jgi:hypothetical protein
MKPRTIDFGFILYDVYKNSDLENFGFSKQINFQYKWLRGVKNGTKDNSL